MATAEIAFGYNRDVFALPGRTTDIQSQGCNNLIKIKSTHLVSTAADIPFILNWTLKALLKVIQKKLFTELDPEEIIIYNFLKAQGKSTLDTIAVSCQTPTSKAVHLLLRKADFAYLQEVTFQILF